MNIFIPIFKRPSTWVFVSSLVAFLSVYALEDEIDLVLLLNLVKAFLALFGIAGLVRSVYVSYSDYMIHKTSAGVEELTREEND